MARRVQDDMGRSPGGPDTDGVACEADLAGVRHVPPPHAGPADESTVEHVMRAVRESQPSASRPQDAGLKIGGDPTCGGPVDLRANCRTARIACISVLS